MPTDSLLVLARENCVGRNRTGSSARLARAIVKARQRVRPARATFSVPRQCQRQKFGRVGAGDGIRGLCIHVPHDWNANGSGVCMTDAGRQADGERRFSILDKLARFSETPQI
jgi:hypothetical protein